MRAFPSLPAPAAVFARLLNTLLQREDWARTRLSQHAGKTIGFVIGRMRLQLSIDSSGLTQTSDPAIVPDVTLTIPSEHIASLPGLIRAKDPSQLTRILHIQGDAGLAHTVSDLARDLRWDIEDDLAGRVGDIAALRLLHGGASLLGALRQSARHLGENAGEFLAHESGLMANRTALDVFQDDLDSMEQRLQSLESRMSLLTADASAASAQGRAPTRKQTQVQTQTNTQAHTHKRTQTLPVQPAPRQRSGKRHV